MKMVRRKGDSESESQENVSKGSTVNSENSPGLEDLGPISSRENQIEYCSSAMSEKSNFSSKKHDVHDGVQNSHISEISELDPDAIAVEICTAELETTNTDPSPPPSYEVIETSLNESTNSTIQLTENRLLNCRQPTPVIVEFNSTSNSNTTVATSSCNCACHHTHHHHHHHTIVINGNPELQRDPTSGAVPRVKDSFKVGVLKTASCPPWADGAPKTGRPIENRYNFRENFLPTGGSPVCVPGSVLDGRNYNNNTNTRTNLPPPVNLHDSEFQVQCQGHEHYSYTGPRPRTRKCWKLSKGMTILLAVLFIIIISLLCGLVFFLIRSQAPPSDSSNLPSSSNVPTVSMMINQTSVCGIFPKEYLQEKLHGRGIEEKEINESPPKNDSRLLQSPRIIGGTSANILQYPWQGVTVEPTDSDSQTNTTESLHRLKSSRVSGRIYGGRPTKSTQIPWQVRLQVVSLWRHEAGITCGGSIILKDWVLTAAHCTFAKRDAKRWTAYMGMSAISDKKSPDVQISGILKIIQHEKYADDWSYDYDISLMKLKTPVTFSPAVQPICLPPANYVFTEETPNCYISGWGAIDNSGQGGTPNLLQHAQVDIIGYDTCRRDDWLSSLVTDRMMCAGKLNGSSDACQGDSGGPLSCYNATKKVWTLAGSVSWGIDCGQPKHPGVYTKIPVFIDWIWSNIGISEGWIETPTEPASLNDTHNMTTSNETTT